MTNNTDYISICKLLVPFSIIEDTSFVAGPFLAAYCHIIPFLAFTLFYEIPKFSQSALIVSQVP